MSKPIPTPSTQQPKSHPNIQSRITDFSSPKLISRTSYNNSFIPSSSNSCANISMNFTKDIHFPKLFTNSPLILSINSKPVSAKNSGWGTSSLNTPLSSGVRTFSVSSLRSSTSTAVEKGSSKVVSHFCKKSKDLIIDISEKGEIDNDKTRSSGKGRKKQMAARSPGRVTLNCHTSLSSCEETAKIQTIKIFIRMKPSQTRNLCVMPYIAKIDENHLRVDGKNVKYNHVFAGDSLQQQVFEKVAKPVILGVLDGYNGSIFAYGQTGSGKTHTIFGGQSKGSQGLITRSISHIFANIKTGTRVLMSLLEIYKQQLIDLLGQGKTELKIKQTAQGEVIVQGQLKLIVDKMEQTLTLIHNASKLRRVATTKLNQKSSRSHTILTIYIENMNSSSKLCLIDLAGSQKASKSGANGQNFQQMKKINYSLSCLGNVINALVTRKKSDHIPFRDSKLTRLLKDSLSGRFRTSIIVNCSSDPGSYEETVSSLKFADRAKKVKISIIKNSNKEKQNIEYLHHIIEKLNNDLQTTKKELNKYKLICADKLEECSEKELACRKQESPELTTRQTIPSQRVHLEQQMKKYGKENINVNMLRFGKKQRGQKSSINLSGLSSLNVSKSTMNIYGQIGSPSVSSLTYRPDENLDDFSFHFSSINGGDIQEKITINHINN